MNSRALFLSGMAAILLSGLNTAVASELGLTVSTAVTISMPTGQGRLLLALPSLSELQDQWVTNATLSIPLTGDVASDVEIEVDALTTSWGAGATWSSPWSIPGGDREQTLASGAILRAGSSGGTLTADVTDLVRAMVEGDIEEHGFVLLPSNSPEVGFSQEELALLSDEAAGATLQVSYRDLRALGFDGGANALLARIREARVVGDGHPR